jgi:hypothetical protein
MKRAARRKLLMTLGGVLGAALAVYGLVIAKNVSELHKAQADCKTLQSDTSQEMKWMQPMFKRLFDDPASVANDTLAGTSALCASVQNRLRWWHWNWGVSFPAPVDSARDTRLRKALDGAIKRCPALATKVIDSEKWIKKNGRAEAQQRMEQRLCLPYKNARSRLDAPRQVMPIWQWPHRLKQLADSADVATGRKLHPPGT